MSNTETSAPPTPKQLERPHPLTPLIRGWILLVAIAIGLFRELIPDGEPGNGLDWVSPRLLLGGVAIVVALAALASFVSWYFTRFVIDDTELRIESGMIFKSSKKVPFERLQSVDIIQPLAARIFGLAELRLEVGAGDSRIRLLYLSRRKADQLRSYLLARAGGQQASIGEQGPDASLFTDLASSDAKLVSVTAQRLVASFVLSVEWLMSAGILIIVLIVFGALGQITYALPLIIPTAIGAVTLISNRLINMFNFTLAESPRGFRVVRGLTNLTSQSLPIGRIQGIRISQSILWRRFGWYRVDVSVLGVKSGDSEDNERSATSVLLPVADRDQVRMVLDRILPGVDLDRIERHPASSRVKILRWFDFWTLAYGYDDRVVITDHGWLTSVRDVVPHAKVQSVRIEQGPLQRSLGVAHVHFDLTQGPVTAIARHVPQADARQLALTELDRARTARTRSQPPAVPSSGMRPTAGDPSTQQVLQAFGIGPQAEIGRGGEAVVYGLDEHRVLRLYHSSGANSAAITGQLRALYDGFARADVGVALPQILDAGWIAGRWSSVERRLPGMPFDGWLARQDTEARRAALARYLDTATTLQRLPSPVRGFARLIGPGAPQTFDSLAELLTAQMSDRLARSQARLEADLSDIVDVWDDLQDDLVELDVEPALVHGDYFPGNVFVAPSTDPADRTPRISAVFDFSPHTLHADPRMDVVGAVAFCELGTYDGAMEDAAWLSDQAVRRFGPKVPQLMSIYRRFYGFYFSDTYDSDPATYAWCLRQLRR